VHNEEYIESGILELYAAGGLNQVEREEVERRAATSPEVRLALDEACAAMEAYAGLYAIRPKPELKGKILQRIGQPALGEEQHVASAEEREVPVRPLHPEGRGHASAYKWMLAASIALFLLSAALSLLFYSKWQQAEERLAGVMASEQLLARNVKNTTLQLQRQEETLSILRNPEFKAVRLQGVEAHPEARLTVYWNPRQQLVYVDQIALPAPPTGKQYQLWALEDGKPVDAGMIEIAEATAGLQQMKNIGSAQAFAVTLESAGGSNQPTLDQLIVSGQVAS
jgi:anti-sigma-K factor RskA